MGFSIVLTFFPALKDQGGDAASHAAAGADLRGIAAYLVSSVPELCVLASAIIDFAGRRMVAQAIVPGKKNEQSRNGEKKERAVS